MRPLLNLLFAAFTASICFAASRQVAAPPSVQGYVLSRSGEIPLRGVELLLVSIMDPASRFPAQSGSDGSFKFYSVPAGRYLVLEVDELTSFLKSKEQGGQFAFVDEADRTVVVKAGQTTTQVLVHLYGGAIIQGKVTDPDGRPAAGLRVGAVQSRTIGDIPRMFPAGGNVTDQDGTFQIRGLRDGSYVLAADLKRKTRSDGTEMEEESGEVRSPHWLRTFYPSTLAVESAGRVTIAKEQVISDLNIQMIGGSTYVIRGVVDGAVVGHSYRVYVQRKSDVTTLRMIRVASGGSFSIAGLAPESYQLKLLEATPGMRLRGPAVLTHAEVEVDAKDVDGVRLAIKPVPDVVARVIVRGGAILAKLGYFCGR